MVFRLAVLEAGIQIIHNNIGLGYESLAIFGKVETKELEGFMENSEILTEQKKLVVAIRIMYLHFILKEKYTVVICSD